jgi:electron transfer flavoprotein alpha/beta subunit
MKAIVCIKQVPESPDPKDIRFEGHAYSLSSEGIPHVINPFDLYALEEALRMKDAHGGSVTVLTMGPEKAIEALREAIAMGADEAVLLNDPAFKGGDSLATARVLSAAVKKVGEFDVLLCGMQSIDGSTAQVGPAIAGFLRVPQLTYVAKVDSIDFDAKRTTVHRMLETGKEVVECTLPAVMTVVKDINQPRFASLLKVRKASKAVIPVWTAQDLGLDSSKVGDAGSPTVLVDSRQPEPRAGGEVLEGEPEEVAAELVSRILDTKMI